jgi:CHAT domain-containing protein/Tfp pilus assembly protein PilF
MPSAPKEGSRKIDSIMGIANLGALPSRTLLVLALFAPPAEILAQTTHLELGEAIQRDLSVGQTQTYSIRLDANQYIRAVVTQQISAVAIELVAPDGTKAMELDTGDFPAKPSRVLWVSPASGEYLIRVSVSAQQAGASHYEIKLEELRAAGSDDEKRVEAERFFTQGLSEARRYDNDQANLSYTRALALYGELRDREREGDTLTAAGWAYTGLSQHEKAMGCYQQALTIRREDKDRKAEGRLLNDLGWAYENLTQHDKALEYFAQALTIQREVKDRQGEGATLDRAGWVYESLSQHDRALAHFNQALAIARDVKDRNTESDALNNSGVVYYSLSKHDEALKYFTEARLIQQETKDRRAEGDTVNNIGAIWLGVGQYEKAIGYLQQALAIRREVHDRQDEGSTLDNIGLAYKGLGQYGEAIRYFEQALPIERELKDRGGEGVTLNNTALAYASLSSYEQSIAYLEQAVQILREVKDRHGEESALTNLGVAYGRLGKVEKALEYFAQALPIQHEVKDRPHEAATLTNIGWVYDALLRHDKALEYYGQALAIQREVNDRQREGATVCNIGSTYASLGQREKAIGYYQQALAIQREVKDRLGESNTLAGLMMVWQASGKSGLAIFYGKQAVNTTQSIRSGIRGLSQDLQQSFLKGNEKPYHTLAELLIAQGRLAEAEQVLGLLKEEEYFEYIRRDGGEASLLNRRADLTPEETECEKHYHEIGDRLMAIGAERGELLAKSSKNALTAEQMQRLVKLEQDLAAGNQALDVFLGEMSQHFSAKPEMSGSIKNLRETQAMMADLRELPAGTVAIFTLIGEDKFYAILRTPDAQKAYEYPVKGAYLNAKVMEFRQVAQDPERDPRPLGQELYKILMGGMAEDLRQAKAQTLMWSLDGALRYVPLAALYDGKQYLIERYRMSVMTLASNSRLKDAPSREWTAAGFGATATLPSVSSELAGIISTKPGDGGTLSGEIRLDAQFTQPAMRQALLRRRPVVHIASHFRFQPGNDAQSFLLLGDGGHLSMAELKTSANLFEGVQLLTLSACNTGMGDGTEVEGFGALAQMQGAKAVIASLWPVADASTSLLMPEFYRIRKSSKGISKLEALREAQLKLLHGGIHGSIGGTADRSLVHEPASPQAPTFTRDPKAPYAHPYFWAPFFLMGNWL